jgi:hypothetical protein
VANNRSQAIRPEGGSELAFRVMEVLISSRLMLFLVATKWFVKIS